MFLNKRKSALILLSAFLSMFFTVLVPGFAQESKPGPRELLANKCTTCHNLDRVNRVKNKYSREKWENTISRMVKHGAKLNEKEKEFLAEFLSANEK